MFLTSSWSSQILCRNMKYINIKYSSCTINPKNSRVNYKTKSKKELPRKSDIVYNSQNVLQAWNKYTHQCTQLELSSLHENAN